MIFDYNQIDTAFKSSAFNMVSFLITLASVFLAIYFYSKAKKIKKPKHILRTIPIVKESIKKIEPIKVLYLQQEIKNLSVTLVAWWNEGKDPISFSDVSKTNPIRIKIKEEFDILECSVLHEKNSDNGFNITLSEDKKSAIISFDYFCYKEGVILQLYHTGNKNADIEMIGGIKSVKTLLKSNANERPIFLPKFIARAIGRINPQIIGRIVGWLTMLCAMFLFIFVLFMFFNNPADFVTKNGGGEIFMALFWGGLYTIVGYQLIRKQTPKGFDIFNEEF